MAKRRLTKQQQQRISNQLDNRIQGSDPESQTGLLVAHHGKTLIVEDAGRAAYRCTARQNIGQPVCGDRVVWHPISTSEGVITAIQERESLLVRPGFADKLKPVAANISLIGIVIAPRPEPQEKLIDSYLVAAEYLHIRPVIIANKTDLLDQAASVAWEQRFAIYRQIGYEFIATSTRSKNGLDELKSRLRNNTGILVGQSGVGKSSLINSLIPDISIKTASLSEQIKQGQHTTSYSALHHLPANGPNDGGILIDSPGVRDFRLGHLQPADIEHGFIEFRPYLGKCRFTDCRHQGEPGCAIDEATHSGALSAGRLASFFELQAEH